ncbi:SpoIID/LytB domain-containing protein [Bacillus infantis]|uniref:SpoIID/LytB domain-containing protein n=1 Tax=Bacillus infantis TaxID=324767 RepID=UPI002002EFC1|nr:SpoIID/LytB domain-containing protein [Bacillus infantis]MCK6206044.1 SpoIID/LytB domain-containing protein [Bacillus infantis]
MMMKKAPLLLMIIAFFTLLPNIEIAEAAAPAKPVTYLTQVKVKLLPSAKFSLNISGKYQIVNLDDNSLVPLTSLVTFEQKSGKATVISNQKTYTSSKGFLVNEIQSQEANEVAVSAINTSSGAKKVTYRGSFEIVPGTSQLTLFNKLDMENYLKGVVPSEMPASWSLEALKAQAVAARSYAYRQVQASKSGYLEMTVSSQVYGGKTAESARSTQAVQETNGIYATYNNVPIDAYFHSSSGGYTENSENVWSGKLPYMRAVEDPYDKLPANYHYGWESIAQAGVVKQKLGLAAHQVLTGLKIVERGPSSGATQMAATVYNKTTKENNSILLTPKYAATPDRYRSLFGVSLKSIKFNVYTDSAASIKLADGSVQKAPHLVGYKIKKADGTDAYMEDLNMSVRTASGSELVNTAPNKITFKGDGWGHLLGMSQWGARGMAEAGYKYDQILKHYYTGIEVKKL